MPRPLPLLLLLLALVGGLLPPTSAVASDPVRARALELARDGRCEVALVELDRLRGPGVRDAEVERLTGECALRLELFGLAVAALERARSLDPESPDVELHLAIAYYHQGEVDAAEVALRRAAARDADAPTVLLYSGLIAFEREDWELAAARLEAASESGDPSPEPMASFYRGRALAALDRVEDADASFERVEIGFAGTAWAEQAERARRELREAREVQLWASAEVGFEYDDNVLLRGRDVQQPTEISGKDDERGVWFLEGGAEKDFGNGFRGGGQARYGGSAHEELQDFDTHAPGATLWLDRALGRGGTATRLQYDFDAAWIDEDPYLQSHLVTVSLFQPWGASGVTLGELIYGHDDYDFELFDIVDGPGTPGAPCPIDPATGNPFEDCGPLGLDEKDATNRTGDGLGFRLTHSLPLPVEIPFVGAPSLRGALLFQRYWADGSEYDNRRHQIEIEAGAVLPFELSLRVGGSFAYVAYDNRTSFPDPSNNPSGRQYALQARQRRERETGVWIELDRPIREHVIVSARFRRTRNRSNAEVFDYDQNEVGFSVRVALGG